MHFLKSFIEKFRKISDYSGVRGFEGLRKGTFQNSTAFAAAKGGENINEPIRTPVSYTHLDVYKRQIVFWGASLIIWLLGIVAIFKPEYRQNIFYIIVIVSIVQIAFIEGRMFENLRKRKINQNY